MNYRAARSVSLTRIPLLLIGLALLSSCGGGNGGGINIPAFSLIAPGSRTGRIVVGAASETLTVKLTDSGGNPRSGATIAFVAPEFGSSGTFAQPAPEGAHVFRGQTDANGEIKATFTSNGTPGVYHVSAHLESPADTSLIGTLVTFGLTNRAAALAPALTAEKAREALERKLFGGSSSRTSVLHGPVLLEAGTVVGATDPVNRYPTTPVNVGKPSWFFWVDDAPDRMFAHPTRFALMDAGDAAAGFENRAQVTNQNWWPRVTLPGGRVYSLLPTIYIEGANLPTQDIPGTRQFAVSGTRAPDDACAIIVYGPNLSGSGRKTSQKQRDFLIRTDKVKSQNIMPANDDNPTSCDELKQLIMEAKNKGCKKLYLFIDAHGINLGPGFGGGFYLADKSLPTSLFGKDPTCFFFYSELARLLEPVGAELCVVISACYSGSAIAAFQNRGLKGWITTAADAESPSYWHWASGYNFYARNLLNGWEDPEADSNRDGKITQEEAHAWVLKNPNKGTPFPGSATTGPKPQSGPIGESTAVEDFGPVPPVGIVTTFGSTTVTINRGNVPVSNRFVGQLTISNSSIAGFAGTPAVININFLPGDIDPISVIFFGNSDGETTYQLTGRTEDDGKRWASPAAPVKVGSAILPNPTPVILRVGDFKQVTFQRTGVLATLPDKVTFVYSSNDSQLFTLSITEQFIQPGVKEGFSTVQSKYKTGTSSLSVYVKEYPGLFKTVPVTVVQEVTLDFNLTDPVTGAIRYRSGEKILLHRITGFKITSAEVGCDGVHLHADNPSGIFIDGIGPFPDPNPMHCGYGRLIQPPP